MLSFLDFDTNRDTLKIISLPQLIFNIPQITFLKHVRIITEKHKSGRSDTSLSEIIKFNVLTAGGGRRLLTDDFFKEII